MRKTGRYNVCVNEAMVEENHHYYKDENIRYIKCSIMLHCLTCNSASAYTWCQEEFNLNNNKCNEQGEENSGLSKRAVAGISLGSILFLLILIVIAINNNYKYI